MHRQCAAGHGKYTGSARAPAVHGKVSGSAQAVRGSAWAGWGQGIGSALAMHGQGPSFDFENLYKQIRLLFGLIRSHFGSAQVPEAGV